jgi:hypothetical protein
MRWHCGARRFCSISNRAIRSHQRKRRSTFFPGIWDIFSYRSTVETFSGAFFSRLSPTGIHESGQSRVRAEDIVRCVTGPTPAGGRTGNGKHDSRFGGVLPGRPNPLYQRPLFASGDRGCANSGGTDVFGDVSGTTSRRPHHQAVLVHETSVWAYSARVLRADDVETLDPPEGCSRLTRGRCAQLFMESHPPPRVLTKCRNSIGHLDASARG